MSCCFGEPALFLLLGRARDLLGVTPRTLRTYRRKGYLGFIKIEGRILFLRHQLFRDLEELYYKSKKKED